MGCLIDSDTCIYYINKRSISLIERVHRHMHKGIYVSSIVLAELEFGVAKSAYPDRNLESLQKFLVAFEILDFDSKAAACYGKIRTDLQREGKLIGPLDMLIAAHAQSAGLTLVTNNTREFSRIPELSMENWI